MSHTLVVDVGNSRMKWALVSPLGYVAQGIVPNAEIGTLAVRDWQNLPRPARALGVNVAGEAARVRVEGQLTRWRIAMEWLVATAHACGVTNRYSQPSQLGADRWAACIAARLRANDDRCDPAADHRRECRHRGHHRFGRCRRRVPRRVDPAEHAADASLARGEHVGAEGRRRDASTSFRRTRPTALYTGALHAVCGAIELARARLVHAGRAGPLLSRRRRGAGNRPAPRALRWSSWIIWCSRACWRSPAKDRSQR